MSDAIEIIQYKLNETKDFAKYVEATSVTTNWAKSLDGFKFHTISVDEDGLWTEALYWSNMDCAKSAHARFMKDIGGSPFFTMIDHSSFKMSFGQVMVMEQ